MTEKTAPAAVPAPSTAELLATLTKLLTRAGRVPPGAPIALTRRPSVYGSSHALEEIDVSAEHAGGTRRLSLVFKDLSPGALLADARHAKPAFLRDPLREIEAYRRVLAPHQIGGPAFVGTTVDPRRQRYWLFLQRVPGVPLWQAQEPTTWQAAARWLAGMHRRLAGAGAQQALADGHHFLVYDAPFYRRWLERGRAAQARRAAGPNASLDWLAGRYERVVARLSALPATFIHGEFYPSNVLVQEGAGPPRIWPVDWEMAGIGPGMIDLAALTSGTWGEPDRQAIALSYHAALRAASKDKGGVRRFLEDLDYCRLHLAVQWLGWSATWSPPPEHAHEWFAEAMHLAEKLCL